MRQLTLGAAMLVSASAYSVEVSYQQLAYLQQLSLSDFTVQSLSSLQDESAEATWYQHLRLNNVAIEAIPSSQQVNWVSSLLKSPQVISIANPDHPNQQLTVVNISQQAKATLKQWDIRAEAREIDALWFQGNLNGQLLKKRDQRAVHNWLSDIPLEQLQQVASSIEADDQLGSDNGIVSILAMRSKDPAMFVQLWKLSADQYSYQALQKIPALLDEEQAVAQLSQATANPALFSQALILMVKHFPQHPLTQEAFQNAFSHSQQKWIAIALLKNISDTSLLHELSTRLSPEDSVAAQLVEQRLREVQ